SFQDCEEPLAFALLLHLGECVVSRRVIDERGPDDCSCHGQRAASPPEVERRRMPVADRLFARRFGIDSSEWERYFDEFGLMRGQQGSPATLRRWATLSGTLVWAKCKVTSRNGSTRYRTVGSTSGSFGTEATASRHRSGFDLAFWTCCALTLISR